MRTGRAVPTASTPVSNPPWRSTRRPRGRSRAIAAAPIEEPGSCGLVRAGPKPPGQEEAADAGDGPARRADREDERGGHAPEADRAEDGERDEPEGPERRSA